MESKSILIEKEDHKKLKQFSLDNDLFIKDIIKCLINNFLDDTIPLLTDNAPIIESKVDIFEFGGD